jgi:tRNA(fMet)-specific endonuclease VapC
MSYLLDTNAGITYLRNRNALLTQRVLAHPPSDIILCSVVVAELLVGARRSQSMRYAAAVTQFIGQFVSLPFDDRAAEEYAEIRVFLEAQGTPIGPYDMQIAAIARAHSLTLVTHNSQEFGRVPGLVLEDWEVP